jgi:predicted nucleic acid-binding protein
VTLVDTSVWINHLRRSDDELQRLLADGLVGVHEFVLGELALGHVTQRDTVIGLLENLTRLPVATHGEVVHFVRAHDLQGSGIGWVDAHLLCAARMARWTVWTADRKLRTAAQRAAVAHA